MVNALKDLWQKCEPDYEYLSCETHTCINMKPLTVKVVIYHKHRAHTTS